MSDQAQGLRQRIRDKRAQEAGTTAPTEAAGDQRVISFTSGKGGVGKTNLVTSLARIRAQSDERVLVMDADLGLANIHVLLGMRPRYTLQDVLAGDAHIRDVLVEGPGGITFLPGGSGVAELTELATEQKLALMDGINELGQEYDTLLLDTGAGIAPNVLYFNQAAAEVVTVVVPEPTSIADAYGMIKVLHRNGRRGPVYVLVNMARTGFEAAQVFERLSLAASRFLGIELVNLGWLPQDSRLAGTVRQQRAFVDAYPQARLAERLRDVSGRLAGMQPDPGERSGLIGFWSELLEAGGAPDPQA